MSARPLSLSQTPCWLAASLHCPLLHLTLPLRPVVCVCVWCDLNLNEGMKSGGSDQSINQNPWYWKPAEPSAWKCCLHKYGIWILHLEYHKALMLVEWRIAFLARLLQISLILLLCLGLWQIIILYPSQSNALLKSKLQNSKQKKIFSKHFKVLILI